MLNKFTSHWLEFFAIFNMGFGIYFKVVDKNYELAYYNLLLAVVLVLFAILAELRIHNDSR
jgi:hypothetical protein